MCFPRGSDGKESSCNTGDLGSIPGLEGSLGDGMEGWEWLPTPVFLPGEFHGQRSLAGYSPWGRKESDTTQRLRLRLLLPVCEMDRVLRPTLEVLGYSLHS